MKTSAMKPITKTQATKLGRRFADWKFSADYSKAARTLIFAKHIDALVFIARISVHAEVQQTYPEIVFTHAKIKITIAADVELQEHSLAFMERVNHSFAAIGG